MPAANSLDVAEDSSQLVEIIKIELQRESRWPAQQVTFATAAVLHGITFSPRNPADWSEQIACLFS